MKKTCVLEFIPQRPPFVLVDNILSCDEAVVVTDFRVPQEHILVRDGALTESGVMENIAQTCAARIGWLNQDKPVRIGVIGSINNFEYQTLPRCGETIITTVTVESSVFEAIIVHADIRRETEGIAKCDMKVFVMES